MEFLLKKNSNFLVIYHNIQNYKNKSSLAPVSHLSLSNCKFNFLNLKYLLTKI